MQTRGSNGQTRKRIANCDYNSFSRPFGHNASSFSYIYESPEEYVRAVVSIAMLALGITKFFYFRVIYMMVSILFAGAIPSEGIRERPKRGRRIFMCAERLNVIYAIQRHCFSFRCRDDDHATIGFGCCIQGKRRRFSYSLYVKFKWTKWGTV